MDKSYRHYIHYIISFYILFGGVITNNILFIKIHAYTLILILLHWLTNNGRCFLGEIDYKYEKSGYTKHLLEKIGIYTNEKIAMYIGYLALIVPTLYSLHKLSIRGINVINW